MEPSPALPLELLHLPAPGGPMFALHHLPSGPGRAGMVFLHALAEEMNKSRRMVALQAASLREAGFAVLVPDLHGCGDSAGEFANATWSRWLDDGLFALRWMQTRHPGLPLWLWGHRAGALLACAIAERHPELAGLLLWQPCLNGAEALQPWQRLRRASAMLRRSRAAPADKRAGGDYLAVPPGASHAPGALVAGGYHFSAELVAELGARELTPAQGLPRTVWLDVVSTGGVVAPGAGDSAAREVRDSWRTQVPSLSQAVIHGSAFWSSTEIDQLPELIFATTQAMDAAVQLDAPTPSDNGAR